MNETRKAKIRQFLNDEVMADIIWSEIQGSFLKARKEKEVYYLAAKSLSVEYLEEARKDLERWRDSVDSEEKVGRQIGL